MRQLTDRVTATAAARAGLLIGTVTCAFCIGIGVTSTILSLRLGSFELATADALMVAIAGAVYARHAYAAREHEIIVRQHEADAQASEHAAAIVKGQRDLITRDLAARQPLDRRH
jgi:high-affinity Fe2+/Pb2+ permease